MRLNEIKLRFRKSFSLKDLIFESYLVLNKLEDIPKVSKTLFYPY